MKTSLKWCKKQGLKLIEPNNNLSEEYFSNAEETLRVSNMIKKSGSNMWLSTQKYYMEYLASYAILMKLGIKCEIHSCTIEIIKLLEKEQFIDIKLSLILEYDKQLRIDNQYYLKNRPVDYDSNKLRDLLLKIRIILDNISDDDIKKARNLIDIL